MKNKIHNRANVDNEIIERFISGIVDSDLKSYSKEFENIKIKEEIAEMKKQLNKLINNEK